MLKPRFYLHRFLNAHESFYGDGCVKALSAVRNAKTLIITTKSVFKLEYFKKLLSFVKSEEYKVVVSPFKGEPRKDEVFEALKVVEDFQPDVIVAVGGGSIIDGAKLIWYFYEKGNVSKNIYERIQSPGTLSRVDFYAVPTTCGTGSEVSSAAILTDDNKKIPVVTHDFLPKAFMLDPNLLISLPQDIKIETAIDALTHTVEGYVSNISNPLMDVFSVSALSLIRNNIFESINNVENKEFLLNLQMAAMLAGLVQNHCLVGLCHSISHALGRFNVSHGFLNMCMISNVIKFNSHDESIEKKYQKLFTEAGFSSLDQGLEFVESLKQLSSKKLSDFIDLNDLSAKEVIDEILGDKLTESNPVMPTEVDIKNIIERAYEL